MNPKDIEHLYTNMKPQNPSVDFRDGQLSIQASEYNYCHPKHDHGPYTCFEVAYLVNDSFEKIPELEGRGDDDDVYGYVDIKVIIELLLSEGYDAKAILKILPR